MKSQKEISDRIDYYNLKLKQLYKEEENERLKALNQRNNEYLLFIKTQESKITSMINELRWILEQ